MAHGKAGPMPDKADNAAGAQQIDSINPYASIIAAPSSSVRTEASRLIVKEKSSRLGRQTMVAKNTGNETPPIKNGRAKSGNIASKSVNAMAAALTSLLKKISPEPNPLRNNSPSVCSRRSLDTSPEARRGARK